MTQIIGIAGSLRRGSFNAALLRAAAELVPDGDRLDIESIGDIPLYNYDVEAEGRLVNDKVRDLLRKFVTGFFEFAATDCGAAGGRR